jgi:hypothetical protein
MRKQSALEKLKEARDKAAESKRALLKRVRDRAQTSQSAPSPHRPVASSSSERTTESREGAADALEPRREVRSETNSIAFFRRADATERYFPQPWLRRMTDVALMTSVRGGVHLCLVWPAAIDSIVLVHALATLTLNMATDLHGVRTLLFPGNGASGISLNAWSIDRARLAALYRSLWSTTDGAIKLRCMRSSQSMQSVLAALNYIDINDPSVPNPSLAELIPFFVFDERSKSWSGRAKNPLERSICKVAKSQYRRDLRERISVEWGDAASAPGALLVVHNAAKKENWREALRSPACCGQARPDLMLFDATGSADQRNYNAVRRIPDFLKCARAEGLGNSGALIITDDPRTFFDFDARLRSLGISFEVHCEAVEGEHNFLAAHPHPDDWRPEQKTNSNFSVAIVDRDASGLATGFAKYSREPGIEGTPGAKALMDACLYLLRLSNLPAGYKDLTAAGVAGELDDYSSQQHEWVRVELAIRSAMAVGDFGSRRVEIERLVIKAHDLIDAWVDATPMAARLCAEVRKHALASKGSLMVVLPNRRYIGLANRYLARTLGNDWTEAEQRIEWHTLATVVKALNGQRRLPHVAFAGVNRNVLRILLAHSHVPNGTTVLIAYRQAESILKTLKELKRPEAFKAYRGRIGLLVQELERRLGEFTHPVRIDLLRGESMLFNWTVSHSGAPAHQEYFTFELEGGGKAYSSGWVYRLDEDEDPPFRRVHAGKIRCGDFIFNMTDGLRAQIEEALQIGNGGAVDSAIHPARALLKLYHGDIDTRAKTLFHATTRRSLAQAIHARMVEIDPSAEGCRTERVEYWLDFHTEDSRPHAAADYGYFMLFCRALQIDDAMALNYWKFVKTARHVNQSLGRILAAQYAEVLFHPESATAYRKIPADVAAHLKDQALRCVSRVEGIVAPIIADRGGQTDDGHEQRSSQDSRRLQRSSRR